MHRKPGYSLIEVIIAAFVVAMGTLAFGAMMPLSARSARMNANYQQAVSLIQHKVDQCRAVGFGRLTYTELHDAGIIDASPTSSPYSFTTADSLGNIYPYAVGTLTVSDVSTNLRQVTVAITWGTRDPATAIGTDYDPLASKSLNSTLQAVALIARE